VTRCTRIFGKGVSSQGAQKQSKAAIPQGNDGRVKKAANDVCLFEDSQKVAEMPGTGNELRRQDEDLFFGLIVFSGHTFTPYVTF
jgi:hypothetical protein